MKSYTTKSNAKRAANKIFEELNDRIENIDYRPTFKEDTGFGIYIVLNENNTREDLDTIQETYPNAHFGLLEKRGHEGIDRPVEAKLNKSTVEKPCTLVWTIAESMPGAKRKEVLDACVKAGVAYYTARTQYQQWKSLQPKEAK